jgi:hypothetical protein
LRAIGSTADSYTYSYCVTHSVSYIDTHCYFDTERNTNSYSYSYSYFNSNGNTMHRQMFTHAEAPADSGTETVVAGKACHTHFSDTNPLRNTNEKDIDCSIRFFEVARLTRASFVRSCMLYSDGVAPCFPSLRSASEAFTANTDL